MKVLLLCAGGASTSILLKKLQTYWAGKGEPLEILARSVSDYSEYAPKYDVILIGPQVRYKIDEVRTKTGKPTAGIEPFDYAIGNAENIYKQVQSMLGH